MEYELISSLGEESQSTFSVNGDGYGDGDGW